MKKSVRLKIEALLSAMSNNSASDKPWMTETGNQQKDQHAQRSKGLPMEFIRLIL